MYLLPSNEESYNMAIFWISSILQCQNIDTTLDAMLFMMAQVVCSSRERWPWN